jgi:glycosyltransferase involved in cell wall biosynthesis
MKLVILTNILSPYRKFMFDEINHFVLKENGFFRVLVCAESEPNRHWKYDEFKTDYTLLLQTRKFKKHDYVTGGYYAINLKKVLSDINPDIVIAGGSYALIPVLQSIFLKKKLNFRLLFWSEGNLLKREKISFVKFHLREMVRKATYHAFDGFWNAGYFSNLLIDRYKKKDCPSFFMPNLVDGEYFSQCLDWSDELKDNIRKKYSVEKKKKIILCPARLSYEKGLVEFLDLYSLAKQKHQVTLLIAGDGPLFQEIKNKIKTINADIRLLGYKNQDEILELYAISDVFLLPSNIDPNPLSCIEALHCGLPLLISEHVGNAAEVVKPDVNGYIISYSEKEKAVAIINKIISQDAQWFENAKNKSLEIAHTIYNSNISIPKCLNEMKDYFNLK